jgi:hypothetical protein
VVNEWYFVASSFRGHLYADFFSGVAYQGQDRPRCQHRTRPQHILIIQLLRQIIAKIILIHELPFKIINFFIRLGNVNIRVNKSALLILDFFTGIEVILEIFFGVFDGFFRFFVGFSV